MGVLACDRYKCPNIMCDRLSDIHGYICNECFEELKQLNPESDQDIGIFMMSQKGTATTIKRTILNLEDVFPFK